MNERVPRMNDAEMRAWGALVRVSELLPVALDAQLQADAGLTHFEFLVLNVLDDAEGNAFRIKELAAASNATLPRLSKVVSRLEARGLVERFACEGDGRAISVHLTEAGHATLASATPGHLALVRSLVLDNLTSAQQKDVADALEPIMGNLCPSKRTTAAEVHCESL